MGWLIEMLLEAIKEKCSQFIVDMMELVTSMFTELLSCNLSLFEELFGVVGDLYKNVIVPMAIALLLLILVWQLFKSMFGKMGLESEDPVELVCRSGACLFMVVGSKTIVDYILGVAGTPYQWVVGTDIEVNSFSEYVSAMEGATAALGIDSISVMLLMLIMQFVVAWNYFKMLFIIAERYVLLGVFSYTAPLAFATGGSKATNNILSSWVKMFGGQIVLIIMNAWCMKMFLSGYGNMLASGYGFTKFFVATLCLIGFCKVTFKLDSYMASLGVNLGRPSSGLGAMGLMMAAGRLFGRYGHGSSSGTSGSSSGGEAAASASGSSATAAAGDMAQSMGAPIPMGAEMAGNTENGNIADEETESSAEMPFEDEMEGQADSMEEMENDNILEALGEMPEEGTAQPLAFDEEGDMEEIPDQDGSMGTNQDGGTEMELDGSERLDGMPEPEGAETIQEEGDINGLGDYPVNRQEEEEETETEDEMDLERTIPTGETGVEDATCGSAGAGFEESGSLQTGGEAGASKNTDAGGNILEELGSSIADAPPEVQAGSGDVKEFLETASAGMPAGSESSFSDRAAEEGNETGVFEVPGNAEGFQPEGEAWNHNPFIQGEQSVPEKNTEPQDAPLENIYEIPDVPKSREDLKRWNPKPENDPDMPF